MAWLRQAGAFLLMSRLVRTLPATLSSIRGVSSAGGRGGLPGMGKAMASRDDLRGNG
jgi:hypothetical protein